MALREQSAGDEACGGKAGSRRTLLWGAACAAWICFIWGHSLASGPRSQGESDAVVGVLASFFSTLAITDAHVRTLIVRKGAHTLEYALLGFLGSHFFRCLGWKRRPRAARAAMTAGSIAVPVIDECIQLFVPGRSGSPVDVCIDLAGMALGILISWPALRRPAQKSN